MANYNNLKRAIQSVIKANGNNEITGPILQAELLAMITTLGAGYQYMGVAQPSTNPGTPDARVMYLAYIAGTYVNFSEIIVTGFCVLKYDTVWTKEDIPISSGGVDFLTEPDDLTLETVGNTQVLKFANRSYDAQNPDRMGYKILRKNKTFAEQVTETNTIYEIRDNFEIGGTESSPVSIPDNCILKFNGGILSNGWLNGNGITIESHAKCLDNVYFKNGSIFNNSEIRLSWWHKDGEDCANTIEKLNNIYGSVFFFDLYDVKVSHPVTMSRRSVSIYGFDVARKSSTWDVTIGRMTTISPTDNYSSTGYAKNALLYFTSNQATGQVKSINFEGGDNYVVAYGIYATANYSGIVCNCKFSHLYMAGIFMPSNEQITIENNYASYCGIAFIIGHRDMNESNPYRIGTGGSALVRIKDNYVVFCNCSCIAVIGTDGQITNNCFSHSSIYGLRVQSFQSSINIFGNYFEGNGKSSFWIDENGFQGATDSDVMCSHLANAHVDEWGRSVQGWGYSVSGLRIRSHVVASGGPGDTIGATFFIGTNYFSSNNTRTKINDTSVSIDDQAVGLDCLYTLGSCNATIVASNPVTDVDRTPKFFICNTCIYDTGGSRAFGELNIVSVPDQYKSRKDWLIGDTATYMKPLYYNPLSKPASINYPDILSHIGRYDNRLSTNMFRKLGTYAEYYGKKDGIVFLTPKGMTANTYSPNFSFEADYFREGTKVVRIWFWNTGSDSTTITPTIDCGAYGSSPTRIYPTYQKVIAAGEIVSFGWVISPYHIPAGADYLRIDTLYASATLHAETKLSLPYIQDLDESFTKEYKFVNYDDKLRILSGTTSERPVLGATDAGFEYFDSTLAKKILWNGTTWVNVDGSALA